ncbi:Peptidase S54 rhomboid domain-containing protein [Caenorhabditis elegans]|uniref:Peptidase S54 rhomboid domain-containing protein n=1 Tax=Caenorhabditis elegans TaxID=6239 RepID=Q9U2V5_CAEEL|nr:Peptidase S54 rhomboid domain-containing protein [Caenorhabditis elegans]CAB55122.3 Peptidase S54 rhomboid domain-containing protein [Caenorhabditis elegans]|eukprot:NP_001041013.2 Rhomboid-like protein [Caenorhabditis elegans]
MASAGTPGSRRGQQENTPLSGEKTNERPPLNRDSSLIQQFSHFIGISGGNKDGNEEKTNWNAKRLRHIKNRYSLKEDEVNKFVVRNQSVESGAVGASAAPTPSSIVEDIEKGIIKPLSTRTPIGRAPIGPTPSLPNYASSSFESGGGGAHGRSRADSFSQTAADLSQSQTRLSKSSQKQRESVPSAIINSVSNFVKKGSLINKKRLKFHSSFASKCSFDLDMVSEAAAADLTEIPDEFSSQQPETGSPSAGGGLVFKSSTTTTGESFEMKPIFGKTSKESELITSGIPEETSFEVEIEEMGDIDEAQGGEMDPSAMSRMTAKVRKKSSIRVPPLARFTDEASSLTSSRSAPIVQRCNKTLSVQQPERPSDLAEGTKPIIHPSASLPGRVGKSSFLKKKSSSTQEDVVLELLAEESEQKDLEDGRMEDVAGPSFRIRSRKPTHPAIERSISLIDEVFFDTPPPHLRPIPPELQGPAGMPAPELEAYHPDIAQSPPTSAKLAAPSKSSPFPYETAKISVVPEVVGYHQAGNISYIDVGDSTINRPKPTVLGERQALVASKRPDRVLMQEPSTSSRRGVLKRQHTIEPIDDVKYRVRHEQMSKFTQHIKSRKEDQKRQRGIGRVGQWMGRSYKDNLSKETRKMLAEGTDERPWFTYWITTIQIFVCLLSLLLYGFAPFGLGMEDIKGDVMDTTLSSRRVSYLEQANPWIGPHYADLIRLGAVYSPCMRREFGLWEAIEEGRRIENRTGCCIANDHSGCYQSSESICPRNVARWLRWDKPPVAASKKKNFLTHKSKSDSDLLHGLNMSDFSALSTKTWTQPRKSGAVCGQDPSYCDLPLSVAPYEWPDDITQWPICRKKHEGAGLPEHVTCQVTGRPCCIQLQGLCRIATKQYCDFVRGHWHENATLCSQVNCFSGVCGMVPFFFGDNPNQFYRLFTSLFVHAGVIHLALSLLFQYYVMKDLENLIASKRMAILYFASGIGGNLASAIFVPYNPAVGPSSAQCGILAAVIVECCDNRRIIKEFKWALVQHLIVTLLVLCIGFIPWVDNWAHLFGTIFGLLTTIIIFPYLDFGDDNNNNRDPSPNTVPNTPLMPRGSMSTMINIAETPTMTAQGYSQLANGLPSSGEPDGTTVSTVRWIWRTLREKFKNKRTFYVLISTIVLSFLLFILFVVFFGNVQFDCPWCIYFNCLPVFECHNQGQKLKKWLPI